MDLIYICYSLHGQLKFMKNPVDFKEIDGTPSVPQMDDCDDL